MPGCERRINCVERSFVRGPEFRERHHPRKHHASTFCLAETYDLIEIIKNDPRIGSIQHVIAAEFNNNEIGPGLEHRGETLQSAGGRLTRHGAIEYDHIAVAIGMQTSARVLGNAAPSGRLNPELRLSPNTSSRNGWASTDVDKRQNTSAAMTDRYQGVRRAIASLNALEWDTIICHLRLPNSYTLVINLRHVGLTSRTNDLI
jgi:hypothetical protein